MKRSKGHPDAPTPANSPQKKRVCKELDDIVDLPSPQLLFPSAATKSSSESSSNENDVFGIATHKTTKQVSPEIGTLLHFWSQESIEEKTDRDHQGFEELRTTRERRELEEDRMTAMKKDWQRAHDREQQQEHREKVQERKVANGWKPGQKRVSQCIICCDVHVTNLASRNILKNTTKHPISDPMLLRNTRVLAVNIMRTDGQNENLRAASVLMISNNQKGSTGLHLFSGLK
jgi:hypothetical protein